MRVAFVGNPNSGKTSLFNKLTGNNQKIGNWPGVTIEKKVGKILKTDIDVVDLPGVYSLFPFTSEEKVSRDYLVFEKPDLVVNVIDSTALERSLYLTTQLFDLGVKVILALNMADLLEKKGINLDETKLASELNLPAIKISARTGLGIESLISEIKKQKTQGFQKSPEIYSKIVQNELKLTKNNLNLESDFLAIEKLITEKQDETNQSLMHTRQVFEKVYQIDSLQVVVGQKYEFISKVIY